MFYRKGDWGLGIWDQETKEKVSSSKYQVSSQENTCVHNQASKIEFRVDILILDSGILRLNFYLLLNYSFTSVGDFPKCFLNTVLK